MRLHTCIAIMLKPNVIIVSVVDWCNSSCDAKLLKLVHFSDRHMYI